jgi:WD40 repeat protein
MNTCPSPAVLERAFTALLLDDVEDPAIVAHVEVCGTCQSWLEAMLADGRGKIEVGREMGSSRPEQTTDIRHGLLPAPDQVTRPSAGGSLLPDMPGYEILGRLGKGGMGVVYKALHLQLQRVVALKMIRAGENAGPDQLARFHLEAEAVARLRHPHIVEIYDVGMANGLPYIALEYLPGGSLKQLFGQGPLPARRSAELLATLAQAVHTAHLAGLVHRDLKPSNVLLAEDGTAKVVDFGLVKRCEEAGQTQTGEILGTPSYMAPEQAKGESKSVGPSADVYALGAILYEALTGGPPFQGQAVMETLQKVLSDEPVPPRQRVPGMPADLEMVCLKALRKDPRDRYATAREFADELDRFLNDEPVRARPLSRLEKFCRWCRRKPAAAALSAATVGLLLLAGLAGILAYFHAELRQEHERTGKALAGEQQARRREKRWLYVTDISMADRFYRENQLLRARQLLEDCAPDQRGWEWRYLDRIAHAELLTLTGHVQPVYTLAFAPRRGWLVSGAGDGSLVFWEPATARRLLELPGHSGAVWSTAFSPDGTRLASVAGAGRKAGELIVWDLGTGSDPRPREALRTSLEDRVGERAAVAYHPARPLLAVATGLRTGRPGSLLLLDDRGTEVRRWSGTSGRGCVAVAWSPDGRRLAAAFLPAGQPAAGGEVVVLDPDKAEPVRHFEANGGRTAALAFSPDGRTLASGGEDNAIELRDAETFALRKTCSGHAGPVTSLVFAADGRLVSGATDTTVRAWDPAGGERLWTRRGHYAPVRCVAIQPETGRIYSGSDDITVKAWRADKSQESEAYRLHQGAATAVAFSPDGAALISVGLDGAVWRIDPAGKQPPWRLLQVQRSLRQVRFLPDGLTLLVAGGDEEAGREDGIIRLLDLPQGGVSGELDTHLALVSSLSVSRDGRRLSVVGRTREQHSVVQVWDLASRPPRCDVVPAELLPGTAVAAQLYAGGNRLVVLLSQVNPFLKPSCVLLDLSGGPRAVPGTRYPIGGPCFAVFTGDESLLFLGGHDQGFSKFKVARSGLSNPTRCAGHAGAILNGALSPDDRLFATASEDETIRLWDREIDRELLVLRGDAGAMNDVAFSPTGGFVAAAQGSGTVRVWNGGARPEAGGPSASAP